MATLQCRTCAGIYDDVLSDGTRYFHACPPLSLVELDAAVTAGTVRLRPGETVEAAHARRAWPRANARDENVDREKVAAARTPAGTLRPGRTDADVMKAPGAGADPVATRDPNDL